MSRLPSAIQPAWPLLKRVHRLLTRWWGVITRRTSQLSPQSALPRRAVATSRELAASEPDSVTLHPGLPAEEIDRPPPYGDPADHGQFASARRSVVVPHYVLEMRDGAVAGEYGVVISASGTMDHEISEYFGTKGWREHPIFLAPGLPPTERIDGSVVALATRGGNRNYFHFLLDVLPRWGVLEECLPGFKPDAVYVPREARYQEELLSMIGLDDYPIIPVTPARTVRASTLLVPCLTNPSEVAPRWTVEWLREHLPPVHVADKPSRIYVTRRGRRNTRRLVQEDTIWPMLKQRGFERIDPGTLTVQEQIDHFAAAEVIVGLHGAAMTNLLFARPGVRVLEVFAPTFVKTNMWAISQNIPDARYTYLVGGGPRQQSRDRSMTGIQADIDVDPQRFMAAVDRLEESTDR